MIAVKRYAAGIFFALVIALLLILFGAILIFGGKGAPSIRSVSWRAVLVTADTELS